MTLGEFITARRNNLGYGKMQFSKILGVGDDTLRSWERNKYIPAGKNRTALINILKFTTSEIKRYFPRELIWVDHQAINQNTVKL